MSEGARDARTDYAPWKCLNCGAVIDGPLTDDSYCGCDIYEQDWIRITSNPCPGCGENIDEILKKNGGSWELHVTVQCSGILKRSYDEDEERKGDTLANLGMCQDDFR